MPDTPSALRTRMVLIILALSFTLLHESTVAQVTLRMNLPASTPDGYPVYVAGNFNDWDPAHPGFTLSEGADGRYAITLPDSISGTLEFKFTLGSFVWSETNSIQGETPNRVLTAAANAQVEYAGRVDAWHYWSWPFANSTVTSSVSLLSANFEMPQLGRDGRVFLYLPPDYATSGMRYPVMYALDGQFLFDGTIRPNWGEIRMDEQLDSLKAEGDLGVIVVAVEAVPSLRSDEYLPFNYPGVGGGQASETLAFLVDTLKPYVDANFRTLPDRSHTGLFGISNGGVFATYAAMTRPDLFGRILVFSGAFCLNQEMYDYIAGTTPSESFLRMAFMSGPEEAIGPCEPGSFRDGQIEAVANMEAAGFDMSQIRSSVFTPSAHELWFWDAHFAEMYQWVMNGIVTDVEPDTVVPESENLFEVYPNPGAHSIRVDYSGVQPSEMQVFDVLGRTVYTGSIVPGTNSVQLDALPVGLYFMRIGNDVRNWIKQ